MEQRSQEWYDARLGKFTASNIKKLLGQKGLGETGKSYAFELAVELLTGEPTDVYQDFNMQRGIELEPIAFDLIKQRAEQDFDVVTNATFVSFDNDSGASPDGYKNGNPIEIKCPAKTKFFKQVFGGIDEIDDVYIDQMQMQMMCTNTNQCHYFIFYVHRGDPLLHEIIVPRDEVRIALIKTRIQEAVDIRNNYLKELKEKLQWK